MIGDCDKIKSTLAKKSLKNGRTPEPITKPFKLNGPNQFYNLLRQMNLGCEPNATLFMKSPRKNNLRNDPTEVKVYLQMLHVEIFDEEKRELKMDVRVGYFWQDERLESNKSIPFNYDNFKDSPQFWIPQFGFRNATVATTSPADFIILKNDVRNSLTDL